MKRIITFMIVVFLLAASVSAASFWINPATESCPTTGHPDKPSLSCSGDSEICGSFGCADVDVLTAPTTSRDTDTNYVSATGGFLIDCYGDDGTSPKCDNSGSFWCSPKQDCEDKSLATICSANAWGTATCGGCKDITGNGVADFGDCNGDSGDGCEVQFGSTAFNNNHVIYGTSCSDSTENLQCESGFFACNNGGDKKDADGCEVQQGDRCDLTDEVSGTMNGCFCELPEGPFETGVEASYVSEDPLLWGVQAGSGALMQLNNFIIENDGGISINGVNVISSSGNWIGPDTGIVPLTYIEDEALGANCAYGGKKITFYSEEGSNPNYQAAEDNTLGVSYACHGMGIQSMDHNADGTLTITYVGGATQTTDDITGPKGEAVLSGTSDPTSSEGVVGDLYLNSNSGKVFKKTDVTTWSAVIDTIIGPPGPIAGTNSQLVFNDGGSAAGANVYYDKANERLGVGVPVPTTDLDVAGTVKATTFSGSFSGEGNAITNIANSNVVGLGTLALASIIATSQIDNLAVTTAKIADLAITSAKIADKSVTTAKLDDNSVTSVKIVDGAVTAADIESTTYDAFVAELDTLDSVAARGSTTTRALSIDSDGDEITRVGGQLTVVNTVTAALFEGSGASLTGIPNAAVVGLGALALLETIGTDQIDDASVIATKIANLAVYNWHIADNAINSSQIKDSSITTEDINDSAVTAVKIAKGAVHSLQIADATITAEDIHPDTVSTLNEESDTFATVTARGTTTDAALTIDADGSETTIVGGNLQVNNEIYIDTTKIIDASGNWVGSPTGLVGADGATWISGSGVPAVSLGVLNDFYLDISNGAVYKKGESDWSLITNLQGPQGIPGVPGPIAGTSGQFVYNNAGEAGGAEVYYANSNLGVGVSAPERQLHIRGGPNRGTADGVLRIDRQGNNPLIYLGHFIESPANWDANDLVKGFVLGTSSAGAGNVFSIFFDADKDFSTQGDEALFTVTNEGNVGIGTDNPSSKLDVVGKVTANYLEFNSQPLKSGTECDVSNAGEVFYNDDFGLQVCDGKGNWISLVGAKGIDEVLVVNADSNGGFITNLEKVGIGTDALPDDTWLHVKDYATLVYTSQGRVTTLDPNIPACLCDTSSQMDDCSGFAAGEPEGFVCYDNFYDDGAQTDFADEYVVAPRVGASNFEFVVKDNGVGIGTDNPAAELDVAGTASADKVCVGSECLNNGPGLVWVGRERSFNVGSLTLCDSSGSCSGSIPEIAHGVSDAVPFNGKVMVGLSTGYVWECDDVGCTEVGKPGSVINDLAVYKDKLYVATGNPDYAIYSYSPNTGWDTFKVYGSSTYNVVGMVGYQDFIIVSRVNSDYDLCGLDGFCTNFIRLDGNPSTDAFYVKDDKLLVGTGAYLQTCDLQQCINHGLFDDRRWSITDITYGGGKIWLARANMGLLESCSGPLTDLECTPAGGPGGYIYDLEFVNGDLWILSDGYESDRGVVSKCDVTSGSAVCGDPLISTTDYVPTVLASLGSSGLSSSGDLRAVGQVCDGLGNCLDQISSDLSNLETNSLSDASGNANALYVDANGKVGIGTASPGAKLDVQEPSLNNIVRILGLTNKQQAIQFVEAPFIGYQLGRTTGNKFVLSKIETASSTELLTVRPTGEVGIGEPLPTEALEVAGNVKADYFYGDGGFLSGINHGKFNDATGGGITYTGSVGLGGDPTLEAVLTVSGNTTTANLLVESSEPEIILHDTNSRGGSQDYVVLRNDGGILQMLSPGGAGQVQFSVDGKLDLSSSDDNVFSISNANKRWDFEIDIGLSDSLLIYSDGVYRPISIHPNKGGLIGIGTYPGLRDSKLQVVSTNDALNLFEAGTATDGQITSTYEQKFVVDFDGNVDLVGGANIIGEVGIGTTLPAGRLHLYEPVDQHNELVLESRASDGINVIRFMQNGVANHIAQIHSGYIFGGQNALSFQMGDNFPLLMTENENFMDVPLKIYGNLSVDGNITATGRVCDGNGDCIEGFKYHSGDSDFDGVIDTIEISTILGYQRAGSYHCDSSTEDGYASGSGDQTCSPHDSDKDGDWIISESESDEAYRLWWCNGYEWSVGVNDWVCPQLWLPQGRDYVLRGDEIDVGIGVNPPQEKLHVGGNILADGSVSASTLKVMGAINVNDLVEISSNVITSDEAELNIDPQPASSNGRARVVLFENSATTGSKDFLIINEGGTIAHKLTSEGDSRLSMGVEDKLGIGVLTPTRKLDVEGDVRIRASLYIDCPTGFTSIESQGRQLGCMQTNEADKDGDGSVGTDGGDKSFWDAASSYCFSQFGGRLPTQQEWHISAVFFSTGAPGGEILGMYGDNQYEWVADSSYNADDHFIVTMVGNSLTTQDGADDDYNSNSLREFRCWIGK